MTDKQLETLVSRVPPNERPIAEAKIRQANLLGFKMIGYWEWLPGQQTHHSDLVGVAPNQRFVFLPEPDGIASDGGAASGGDDE